MRRLPQPVMGGQIAIVCTEASQPVAHQPEMFCLFEGDLHPAIEKGMRHRLAGITGDNVEREIDGVEFDMGNGVQQRDTALDAVKRAAFHCGRRNEFRLFRPARALWQGWVQRRAQRQAALEPPCRRLLCERGLPVEIGACDSIRRTTAQRHDFERGHHNGLVPQSFFAASRTAWAWPATFTLFQISAILPSGPTRNVVRSTPMYFFPYMLFSFQTP